ncbi:MAG: two-component regulator propeller domain-containing protein [Reichenbachiella sp.]|uniref:two-component regulator propeller domain-containing protein n=1 Tax=Reichenbachiella sp. TaxID=2184521 RepID=UPI00326417EE
MSKCIKSVFIFLIVFSACEKKSNQSQQSRSTKSSNIVKLNDEGLLRNPDATIINKDSLKTTKAKGRVVSVDQSKPKSNRLLKVKAKRPTYTRFDSASAKEIVPGQANVPKPRSMIIPPSGYQVQFGDTIYAPQVTLSSWPEPKPAQAMRFRDAALYDIQFLDVEQGLPSSYVDAIYEDDLGNMWFGTYGGGVTRYNGSTFTTFTERHGLPVNIIVTILKDKKGNLWFGTDGAGVSKYDGQTFTNYSLAQGFGGIYLETIIEDLEGNIWFGTNGGGLTKYSRGVEDSFTNYSTNHGLAGNNVWATVQDKKGFLWFGTRDGLSRFDGKSFKNFDTSCGLLDNDVKSLFLDDNGNLWIGTEGGLSIFDGEKFINYSKQQGLINNRIWHIEQDINGDMWLGTDGGGVCKMSYKPDFDPDGTSFTFYSQGEGLSYDFIRSIYADINGNMWFGIDGGGVTKFRTNSFTTFTDQKHLSSNSVWSVFQDGNGSMWFGSDLWGIYKYEQGSFSNYMDKEGLLEYSVMDMLEDQSGDMWFATYGAGVFKFDGKTFVGFDEQDGFPHRDVYTMLEDRNGHLWFGTQGAGLVEYDGENFIEYSKKDGLANDRIWNIHESQDGKIWVGTFGGGLSIFDGQSFTNYSEQQGLLNNSINAIYQDTNGQMWIGTDEGINALRYDESAQQFRLYSFTDTDGLVNPITLSLIEDRNQTMWIGTEGGITSLSPEAGSTESYKINTYIQSDGLKGLDVVINSVCLDDQNRIWWGTGKGLTMLDIDNIKPNNSAPVLQLNSLSIGQTFVDFRNLNDESYRATLPFGDRIADSFDDVMPYQNYPINLELHQSLNHLTFNFSAIDWHAPHKVKYQYKLVGLDENWSNLSSNILAEYRNLSYGKYVFQVKAIGTAGIWSDTLTYPFVIVRPWWHQWWARVIYLILALIGVLSFDRWRTVRILTKQKELQENIEDRNRQLEKLVLERTAEIKRQQQITEEANLALEQKVEDRTMELIEKNKKLADYAFVNAHNLRVPVANIKGIIQLFETVQSSEEKIELIELLKGQSNSLDDVLFEIKDMLEKDNYLQNDEG